VKQSSQLGLERVPASSVAKSTALADPSPRSCPRPADHLLDLILARGEKSFRGRYLWRRCWSAFCDQLGAGNSTFGCSKETLSALDDERRPAVTLNASYFFFFFSF